MWKYIQIYFNILQFLFSLDTEYPLIDSTKLQSSSEASKSNSVVSSND